MILNGETRQQRRKRIAAPHQRFVFLAQTISGHWAVLQKVWATYSPQNAWRSPYWRYALTEAELVEPAAPSSPPPRDSAGRSEPLGDPSKPKPTMPDQSMEDMIDRVEGHVYAAMEFERTNPHQKSWEYLENSPYHSKAREKAILILADLFPTPDDGETT